jgi:polysaccharide pyruvyl transferase CsaB
MKSSHLKFFVAGYYGFGSLGDELILKCMLNSLFKNFNNLEVYLLLKKTLNFPENVKPVLRKNFLNIIKSIKKSDAFILGGGGILQDKTSLRSLIYYLNLIFIAKTFNKKIFLLGQSIGPLNSEFSKKLTKKILNFSSLICVREENSLSLLKSIGIKGKVKLTSDFVFLFKPHKISYSLTDDILICPREDKNIFSVLEEILNILRENAHNLFFFPFHPKKDNKICKKLSQENSSFYCKRKGNILDNINKVFSNKFLVIGIRLHSLILASVYGIPFLALNYDPKVEGLIKKIKMQQFLIKKESYEDIKSTFLNIKKNRDFISEHLQKVSQQERKNAQKNVLYLKMFF